MSFDSMTHDELERQFNELVDRESTTISKICFAYAGSVAEYDDLRQDALTNIWRGMPHFRGEASPRTWIYRITVNSCLSTIRSLSRHRHDSLEALYNVMEDEGTNKDDLELLHTIINRLGLQERAVVMMWLDEMSYDEIATVMGVSRNVIATRLHRIKDKIAKQFREEQS